MVEFLAGHDGRLVRDPRIRASTGSTCARAAPAERFYPRLAWRSYPHAAPSVLFADGDRRQLGVMRAWPQIPGYRAPNDICKPFTAEGYALHARVGHRPRRVADRRQPVPLGR